MPTTVQDILRVKGQEVVTVPPTLNVLEATRLMNDRRIGAVVVVEGEEIRGIFTERDVLTRVVAAGRDPATTLLAEVMTAPIVHCSPTTSLEECRVIFTSKRIRHLPVLEEGKLAGLITSGDLLAHEVREHQETIRHLENYIRTP